MSEFWIGFKEFFALDEAMGMAAGAIITFLGLAFLLFGMALVLIRMVFL